jgi:excisionase family DNA binding protein
MTIKHHLPSPHDTALARQSRQMLSPFVGQNHPLRLQILDADRPESIELPAGAVALLLEILEAMASGRGIVVMPENTELTTVEAASILNVSRPFLITLLESGQIPYRKVGAHRRVRLEDVVRYKAQIDHEREQVLDRLVEDAQENDMGY